MARAALLATTMLLSLGFPGSSDAAERGWVDVTVRVYDAAGVSDADEERALGLAADALAPAELDVRFTDCQRSVHTACDHPVGADELALRLVRRGPPHPQSRVPLPLGDAILDQRRRAGTLATIYMERVEWLARESGTDPVVLLGRTIAHELVHALSGYGAHAPRGLMRAVWSAREVAEDRADDWRLHDADKARLKSLRRPVAVHAAAR